MSPRKNQVNFDHPHKNQVNSNPYTEIKSISMSRHKNQVNFDQPHKTKSIDTHPKNKSFSDGTQKQSQLRPPAQKKWILFRN